MILRKKALADPIFPSEDIIDEFLKQPNELPKLQLSWRQPNMVKFIKQVGHLLQWSEIYCFQKFFPILTRWQVLNVSRLKELSSAVTYVTPKEIIKKRVVKGVPSLELLWQDEQGVFKGLIPDNQIKEYETDNPKGIQDLWSTVEPLNMMELAYPSLVEEFLKSKEKPKKASKKLTKTKAKLKNDGNPLGSLENMNDLIEATNDIAKTVKPPRQVKRKNVPPPKQGLQMIDRFFKQKIENAIEQKSQTPTKPIELSLMKGQCSTPLTKSVPSDFESDSEDNAFNMSDIVNAIVGKSNSSHILTSHKGKQLHYEPITQDISILINKSHISMKHNNSKCLDDLDILKEKRLLSHSSRKHTYTEAKRMSMDDSFDVLVKMGSTKNSKIIDFNTKDTEPSDKPLSFVDRFKQKQRISLNFNSTLASEEALDNDNNNVSYFFNNSFQQENEDVFEKFMETSLAKNAGDGEVNDLIFISD